MPDGAHGGSAAGSAQRSVRRSDTGAANPSRGARQLAVVHVEPVAGAVLTSERHTKFQCMAGEQYAVHEPELLSFFQGRAFDVVKQIGSFTGTGVAPSTPLLEALVQLVADEGVEAIKLLAVEYGQLTPCAVPDTAVCAAW
jgi:hypothetical protein